MRGQYIIKKTIKPLCTNLATILILQICMYMYVVIHFLYRKQQKAKLNPQDEFCHFLVKI